MRRFAFYLIEVGVIFLMLTASQAVFGAEPNCKYVWHDHYKNNYRVRHKHKICDTVANHYKEDEKFTVDKVYIPEFYLDEVEKSIARVKNRL